MKNRKTRGKGLTVAIFFCGLCAAAQTGRGQSSQFKRPELLSVLQNARINDMVQDARGSLWLGTDDGLLQYNGYESRFFSRGDGLQGKSVTALATGLDGRLWVGFDNGAVSYYDGQKFKAFKPAAGLSGKKITDILVTQKGAVWFATDNIGLWRYDGQNTVRVDETAGALTDSSGTGKKLVTHALAEDDAGRVWVASDAGIIALADGGRLPNRFITTLNGLPTNDILKLAWGKDKALWWVAANGTAGRIIGDSVSVQSTAEWGAAQTVIRAKTGEIWIGATTGLIRYAPRTGEITHLRDIKRTIHCLIEDFEGTIWLGTNRGAYQYEGDRFQFFTAASGSLSDNILSVYADAGNNIWVGTTDGAGKILQTADGSAVYETLPALVGTTVYSIKEDTYGYIWIATQGKGVFRLQPFSRQIVNYTMAEGLRSNDIRSMTIDMNGTVYLGTAGAGLTLLRLDINGQITDMHHYDSSNGFPGDYIYSLYTDAQNRIWIGTDGQGLFQFDGGEKFQNMDAIPGERGLHAKTILSICEDRRGQFWVSAQGEGVYRYDGRTFQAFRQINGLRELSSEFLIADNLNNLYIGNQFGIDKMRISSGVVTYLDEEDGLLGYDPNLNAVARDPNGIIWIGTTNGLVRFNPGSDIPRDVAPILNFNRLRVVFKDKPFTPGLVFAYDQNHITFDFSGVSLFAPRKVQYKYRLIGYESDWSLETQARFVTYPNLPPGRYTFLLKATNGNGVWTKRPLYYTFEIEAPIWQKGWFYLVLAVGLGGLGFGVVRIRIRAIQRENRVLEERVRLRTAQLARRKTELETLYIEISEQNDRLSQAYQLIDLKNKDVTQSIEYARRLQTVISPEISYIKASFPDSFVLYLPKDIVSGDFYWFTRQGDIAIMAGVDCTGHGVPGAFMSVMGFNQLNETVIGSKIFQADLILEELDRRVKRTLKQDTPQSVSEDGMDMALCVFDFEKNTVEFSCAHRPALIVRNGELTEIKGERFPIGGTIIKDKIFVRHEHLLQNGDMIYLFSDGITDQFDSENKRKFSPQRLKKLFTEIYAEPAERQREIILQRFLDWMGKNEQIDDVLVIGIRFTKETKPDEHFPTQESEI